jgi:triosephosphate isomerase (TIM)
MVSVSYERVAADGIAGVAASTIVDVPRVARRKLIVGNWKMNGSRLAIAELLSALKVAAPWSAEVAVCVPTPYLADVALSLQSDGTMAWGAQDCSAHESGAYTGEVSAAMLVEFGCRYVIVGHSERRALHAESDQAVADKAKTALAHRLTPIVCVGETLDERDAGLGEEVVKRQLSAVIHALGHCIAQVVVAYEPVWAIGTGKTASPDEAQAVHAVLRAQLRAATAHAESVKILYGGSVKADNAASLFSRADIDGGLIGGASLKASDFAAICRAAL